MTQSQEVLLELLSSYIHDAQSSCDLTNVDWKEVFSLSVEQAVAGVVFSEIQRQYETTQLSTLTIQLKFEWFALQQQIAQQNKKVDLVLELVFKTMANAQIPVVLLKGQALAQVYSNPADRTSGDIDLFVGRKYYDQTKQLFMSMGWLKGKGGHEDVKHIGFNLNGIEIELHRYGMLIPGRKQNEYLQSLLEEALENTECGYQLGDTFVRTLPPIENLVYTFAHMFRHFIGGGVGLRQLVDVAILIKKTCTEDFVSYSGLRLYEALKETDFEKAWSVFGYVNVKYLGFSEYRYVGLETKYRHYADKVIETVLNDGNFGSIRKRAEGKKHGAIASYLSLLKSYMRLYKLFPSECKRYAFRQVYNTLEKYASKGAFGK